MKAYARAPSANHQARDRMIAEHIDVARRIALRVARRVPDWLSVDDLIAAAMLGLAEAADRYDVLAVKHVVRTSSSVVPGEGYR